MPAANATIVALAAMVVLAVLHPPPARAAPSGFECSVWIAGRQPVKTGPVVTGQTVILKVNCSSTILSVNAYYGLTLLPARVRANGGSAVVVLENLPLEGTVKLRIVGEGGSTTVTVNITYPKLPRYTVPTLSPEEEARRLSSLTELVKRLYSEGLTAIVQSQNTASTKHSKGVHAVWATASGGAEGPARRGGGGVSVVDAVYFALLAAALLYLLARYLPSLRAGER